MGGLLNYKKGEHAGQKQDLLDLTPEKYDICISKFNKQGSYPDSFQLIRVKKSRSSPTKLEKNPKQ